MKNHEYVMRSTSVLVPYKNNSRTHSAEQTSQVAKSIKEFGFTNPVLIDSKNGIIAGHGRVLAANKLKMEEVPCIILKGLTESQKKAYVIADNQLALNSGWDLDMLRVEVDSLNDLDFDLDLLGFDDMSFLDMPEEVEEKAQGNDALSFGENTSIPRGGSVPVKLWREMGLLNGSVLDYGSGQDVHEFNKYDPFTNPDYEKLLFTYDTVMCNYVLNAQPSNHLIIDIVNIVSKLSRSTSLFAIVNDKSLSGGDACGGIEPRTSKELIEIFDIFYEEVEQVETKRFNGFVCGKSKHKQGGANEQ